MVRQINRAGLRGIGIAQYTSDPVFRRLLPEPPSGPAQPEPRRTLSALRVLIQIGRNYPGPFLDALRSGRARAAVQRFVQIYSRPSLTWADLPFLRERHGGRSVSEISRETLVPAPA